MQCFLWARTMGQFFCSAALVFWKGKRGKKKKKKAEALNNPNGNRSGCGVIFRSEKRCTRQQSHLIYLPLPFAEQKAKELGHFFHAVVRGTHLCLWQRPGLVEFCAEGGGQEDTAPPSGSTSGTVQGPRSPGTCSPLRSAALRLQEAQNKGGKSQVVSRLCTSFPGGKSGTAQQGLSLLTSHPVTL